MWIERGATDGDILQCSRMGNRKVDVLVLALMLILAPQVWSKDYSCGSGPMLTSTKEDGSKVGFFITPEKISKTLK